MPRGEATGARASRGVVLPAVLMTGAVVLGGGGSPAPVPELLVELLAVAVLGVAVIGGKPTLASIRHDRALGLALALIVLFPLIQLVPLPPAWWRLLPGRALGAAAMDATGQGAVWQPWSVLPDAGVAAFCALMPAAVMALLVAGSPLAARVRLVAILAVLGGMAALLGLLQFLRGADRPISFYAQIHNGFAVGFFANRNAQADLVAITLVALVLLVQRHRHRIREGAAWAGVGLIALLLVAGAVVTGSRMGIAGLLVPVALAITLAGRGARWAVPLGIAGGAALLVSGTALDRVAGRVHDAGNRVEIWADSIVVARSVAPVGAGLGSFVPLYAGAERLELVQPSYVNRAHNDYLELAIEGGAPALLLLAGLLLFVGRRAARGWRDADPDRSLLARFGGCTVGILAVHSTVDYPLRTLTLLTIAGLAAGALALPPGRAQEGYARSGGRGLVHA